MNKLASELNRTFSNEEVQMAKNHMRKCLSTLAIKEMKIKNALNFYFTPVTMFTIKNNNKGWQGCGAKGTSYTAGGNVN
jgi:hypothetical protein